MLYNEIHHLIVFFNKISHDIIQYTNCQCIDSKWRCLEPRLFFGDTITMFLYAKFNTFPIKQQKTKLTKKIDLEKLLHEIIDF
jgi:hypothetical protein